MRNLILGFILGVLLISTPSYAYRIQKPFPITDFDQKNLVILNESLENLWDVTNGRVSFNTCTINPDGNLKGNIGDIILFNNSGTYYLAVNVSGAKVWRSILLTDTP